MRNGNFSYCFKRESFDNFSTLKNIVLFSHDRAPIVSVTHRNTYWNSVLYFRKLPPYLFIFLPRYNPSFPPSPSFGSRVKGRNGPEGEMILGEILPSCLARNWAGIFYDMYNLAGCTVVSWNLRSCKPHIGRAFRYGAPYRSEFYPLSVIPVPCPRNILLVEEPAHAAHAAARVLW